jgi:NitT/TauT family transport system substrate-binding protein
MTLARRKALSRYFARFLTLVAALICAVPLRSHAVALNVTHWQEGMYGVPFAVALEKGYFKEAGLDVTGFLTSQGGGSTVRNAMASEVPYGEVALPAAIAAIKQGVPLVIVHAGVVSVADLVWVAKKDSPIASWKDMKGKGLGYSSPKSVTDMVSTMGLTNAGILKDVTRKTIGNQASGMTALREGAVDVIYMTEPVYSREKGNLKLAFRSTDGLPRLTQTVGIVHKDFLKKNPGMIKAIIEARRKGVEYIQKNPAESAEILARAYKLDPAVAKAAIDGIMSTPGTYWSTGSFDYEGMDAMLKGLQLVGAIEPGPFDWSSVIDESVLPADQRSKR